MPATIGLLFPPLSGHLNPMATLGRELKRRGLRVVAFQPPGLKGKIEAEGLEFHPLGDADRSAELESAVAKLSGMTGLRGMRFTLECGRRVEELVLAHAPTAVQEARIDLLAVDANEPAGVSVAQHLGIPYVTIGSLPINREPDLPPPFVPWPYDGSAITRMKNRIAYGVFDFLVRPINKTINRQRAIWKLNPIRLPDDTFSPLAQVYQTTPEFDFPRRHAPVNFHAVGQFYDDYRPAPSFPFDRLNSKPLIYASFGSVLNRGTQTYRAVLEACAPLDAQLVLVAGASAEELKRETLPGSAIVVPFAPQIELLRKAALCITHAGLNTTLESLRFGVPMIAAPVMNDQPAVAARIAWTGTGVVLSQKELAAATLRSAIAKVMQGGAYYAAAKKQQQAMERAGGVQRAGEIVSSLLPL